MQGGGRISFTQILERVIPKLDPFSESTWVVLKAPQKKLGSRGPHPPSDLPPTCSKPLAVQEGPRHVVGRLLVRSPCRHQYPHVLETLRASHKAGGALGGVLGWVPFVQATLFTYGPGAAVPPSTKTHVCPDPTAFLMGESDRVVCGAIHPKDPLPTRAVVRHVWARNATLVASGPPRPTPGLWVRHSGRGRDPG